MQFPILYHKGKAGELRMWRVWTEGDQIFTEYGLVDGKLQVSQKTAVPKNIGKSNETTGEQQAKTEAQSLHTFKLERKYSETPEEAQEQLPLPMLAHSYYSTGGQLTTKGKKFEYPAWVQPKLDGVRCLAENIGGEIYLTSRQGKPYYIPHIQEQLATWLPEGMVLDGEIYVYLESCQKITSWVKSADPEGKSYKPESSKLMFYVYDVPIINHVDDLPWIVRRNALIRDVRVTKNVTKLIDSFVKNESKMLEHYQLYIESGYEGAILRGNEGKYLWGYRSSQLLKVKKFQDAEFTVIGAREGKGKMEGCVIWVCKNDLTDGTFECSMRASMEDRKAFYEARNDYVGKQLTIIFFDRTEDQIPRFPVGITFRDEKDLP
jgi:DNA ligase-1